MFFALAAAATAAQLLTVNAGDPVLEQASTTVSDAARADLNRGSPAFCYRLGPPNGRKLACLKQAEWSRVLKDAVVIETKWKLTDRAAQTAREMLTLRARSPIR